MKISEIYGKEHEKTRKPVVSFEIFPPKDDFDRKKIENLFDELNSLSEYKPSLISVTYGAGGSNRNESLEIIKKIKDDLKITPMPHFTCVSTSVENIKKYLETIEAEGIENILALRGDIPENGSICQDFKYACELIEHIKNENRLDVAAAAYPEGHKEASSFEKDIENLKLKVSKGVDVLYTQLFFNNEHYFRFIDVCQQNNIDIPVIPGILPVISFQQLEKMANLCKVEVPSILSQKLEAHQDDKDYIKKFGIEYATMQCEQLIQFGVKGLHFYTLNKAFSTSQILDNLNL